MLFVKPFKPLLVNFAVVMIAIAAATIAPEQMKEAAAAAMSADCPEAVLV